MAGYLFPFLLTFLIVYFFIPMTLDLAYQKQFVDVPSRRKDHRKPIPLTGGIAMFIGCAISLMFFLNNAKDLLLILIGGLILILVGLMDDWFKTRGKEFSPWPRLIVQWLAATMVFSAGIRFSGIGIFGDDYVSFPIGVSYLATVIWIVGIINMVNFLDGVDGLASGVVAISGLTLFLIGFYKGLDDSTLMATILIGATLGFLRHNFYPASVFMGDAGSTFLGYYLAFISLDGAMKSATLFSIVITILAIGVPILDTIQVIFSRLKRGSPIYKPDHLHVHHRLISIGFNTKQTVMIIYMASIGLSLISLLMLYWK